MEKPRNIPSVIRLITDTFKSWQAKSTNHTHDSELARDGRQDETVASSWTPNFYSGSSISRKLLYLITTALSLLWFLLPRRGRPVRQKAFHELHPMAYLDALRGYLALVIYTGHTMSRRWRWIPQPVLAVPWLNFPIRGGHASLDIFFWISGYAITYRMIGFMQTKRYDKVLDSLASSIFRRYLRLFLPVLVTTFATMVLLETGLAVLPGHLKGLLDGNPLVFWVQDAAHAVNPFAHVNGWFAKNRMAGSALVEQFWSINTEFRSSMILFGFCGATCKMSSNRRKLLIWLCIPAFLCWQAQWAAMAFLGMWFGECRQQKVREKEALKSLVATQPPPAEGASPSTPGLFDDKKREAAGPTTTPTTTSKLTGMLGSRTILDQRRALWQRLRQPFLLFLFLYSFIVVMNPHDFMTKTIFPHNLLNLIQPNHWAIEMKMHFHLIAGAFMMLYPLDQMPILQRPLLTPFSQYLGELSFGIYAVHITVRWMWWEPRYLKWQAEKYGKGNFDFFTILFPGYVVMTLGVLWGADLFRRADMRIVTLCKNLEDWFFDSGK